MAAPANITRRAALVGALLSTAALAVPVVPAVAANLRRESELDALIARHTAAFVHLDECYLRHGRLDDSVELPEPRVKVGATTWAYSEREILALAIRNQQAASIISCNAEEAARRAEEWQQRKLAELKEAKRNYQAARDACGLSDTQAVLDVAIKWEIEARIAVAVYRPRDLDEARIKTDYLRASPPFRDDWNHADPQVIDAMLMALCTPERDS